MKLNKIFSMLACAALMAGAYACTDKVEPTPSPVAGNDEVYFPYTESSEISIPSDATMIPVTVNRVDASAEATVAIASKITAPKIDEDGNVVKDEAGNPIIEDITDVFSVPTSVTFPVDVKEVTLEIGVDFQKVDMDRSYSLDLTIEDAHATSYGMAHRVYTAIYLPWTEWELYSDSEPGIYQMSAMWSYEYATAVGIRKSLLSEDLEQYLCFSPFSDLDWEQVINLDKSRTMMVGEDECYMIWMEEAINTTIVNTNYGEVMYYTDAFNYFRDYWKGGGQFDSDEQVISFMNGNNSNGTIFPISYYNPNEGRFYLYMLPFISLGTFEGSWETLQLPGDFVQNYFNFNYNGSMVNNDDQEFALVEVLPSADIDHFASIVAPGALTDEEIRAEQDRIAVDPDIQLCYDGSLTIAYPFTTEGKYTVIAVGFDKNNEVICRGSKTFTFTPNRDQSWQDLGNCSYTDGIFTGLFLNALAISTWDVPIQESKETPGLYRLVNPYKNWAYTEALEWEIVQGKHYLVINAADPNGVLMPKSPLGIYVTDEYTYAGETQPYGEVSACSYGWMRMVEDGWTLQRVKTARLAGKLEDGVISFPTNGLRLISEAGRAFTTNAVPSVPESAPEGFEAPTTGMFFIELNEAPAPANARGIQPKAALPSVWALKEMLKAEGKNYRNLGIPSQEEIRAYRTSKVQRNF